MSAIVVTLFLGGPAGPTFGLPDQIAWIMPILWFFLKVVGFIFFFILLRGALPRYRYDRLMDLGWKVLIPIALVWTLVTAGFVLIEQTGGIPGGVRIGLAGAAAVILVGLLVSGSRGADTPEPEPGTEGAGVGGTIDDGAETSDHEEVAT
jgi:NADH-quinone oxidoreductase subunit H